METINTAASLNYIDLRDKVQQSSTCTRKTKNGITYLYNEFATFDIETTSVYPDDDFEDFEPFAFMYIWQFYICGQIVIGRTWEEFLTFTENLVNALQLTDEQHLVIYVHNLPYEFQFIRSFFDFTDVFCTAKNKPVRVVTSTGLEFRCSYKLSNMALSKFIETCPTATHQKLSGDDFDYSKFRTPITELSDYEIQYSINDVIGLHETLTYTLKHNGDTLATIPYTSTGYVRREARAAMKSNKRNIYNIRSARLYPMTYTLLKNARRGGNAHCNPYYVDEILENLKSKDMSSAYPAVMLQCKFPMTRFIKRKAELLESLILDPKLALILDVTFINIRVKTLRTVPYLPLAKCVEISRPKCDNGRILSAERLGIVLTDIDYRIIEYQYEWDDIEVEHIYSSTYGYLPDEYRQYVFDRYKLKCDLKGSDEYLYAKEKNKINALFGMMLTDIVNKDILYTPDAQLEENRPYTITHPDLNEALDEYYNSSGMFLSYQWGVWVTAHCRNRLQKAINGLSTDMVYCDTDSAKYFGDHDDLFEKLNEEILAETNACGFNTHYVRPDGKVFDLGLWEDDGTYDSFISVGSKKYGFVIGDDLSITVAGLSKSKGAEYIKPRGGLSCFRDGFVVPAEYSGRTTSHFNNSRKPYYITVNDPQQHSRIRILTGASIAIKNVAYTFGVTDSFNELEEMMESPIY